MPGPSLAASTLPLCRSTRPGTSASPSQSKALGRRVQLRDQVEDVAQLVRENADPRAR
jgi:hypothetical protein